MSRTAENVAVITAEEIESHNAHTLSDVLNLIPGIQLEMQTGPASAVLISVQGADFNHVLVLLDGIQWNSLVSNYADLGAIPAQIIERVEVLKGAASSSWGQALGGVINVITKSPEPERKVTGFASYSRGEHDTNDGRAEVSGTSGPFGYYLAGGHFNTGGFQLNTQEKLASAYQKLTYDLPGQGKALFAFGYSDLDRGELGLPNGSREDGGGRRLSFSLVGSKPLNERFDLELSARHLDTDTYIEDFAVTPRGEMTAKTDMAEEISGGSMKLLWHVSDNTLVFGADYDHVSMHYQNPIRGLDLRRGENRWGFYLNDSLSIGPVTVAPGVRFDITGNAGNQWSPSFGATWQVEENTTLRGYVAKGYGLPSLDLNTAEKVWTAQVGAETSALPHLWLKGTFFHNEVNALTDAGVQHVVKQGFETELRTAPLFNTSLSLGYTFLDARRTATDQILHNRPRHLLLLGGRYDDGRYLRLALLGRQVDWNAQEEFAGSYSSMVWDAHLTVTPFGREDLLPQFFFSIRNAFNGSQYLEEHFKNPGRWVEGGVRWRF